MNNQKTEFLKNKQSEIMRKLILSLVLVLSTSTFFAQSVFDKFEDQEGITSVVVNKKMFALLSKMEVKDKESQQYVNLIKKLDNLRVFVTQSDKKADEMKSVSDKYIKSSTLEELMKITDKGKSVKIYVKSGASESQIKELMMFVEGSGKEETVLMSLIGDFDLNELSVLTDKMNLPGGDDLKKASKGPKGKK
ncbi:hypothetical protein GS03_02532 [Flavobacterium sangjuense]|uniref:DUF4252 domain-containing protein n=2 Tax=Flavobacterium sangjuense TaxID=2518177 RepID=A0A4P7PVH7_9FLAO|nr:hypothetical protein GS03_02532 [Flavobacterium sangjuense]